MYKKIFVLLSLFNFVMLLMFCCFHTELNPYFKHSKIPHKEEVINNDINATAMSTSNNVNIKTTTNITPNNQDIKNVKKRDAIKDNQAEVTNNNQDKKIQTDIKSTKTETASPQIKQNITETTIVTKVENKTLTATKQPVKNETADPKKESDYDDDEDYGEYDYFSTSVSIEKINAKSYLNKTYKNTIMCPAIPPNLVGKINVDASIPNLEDLEKNYTWLRPGGSWSPPCIQDQNLALIIPFRGRESQLKTFLKHMHPFLKKQQLNYTIIVTQQENDSLAFNKGQIMNTAYIEALKMSNFSCFIFNDVDLLPEDDRILYRCTKTARHLTGGIDKWNYKIMYKDLFGGVVAINKRIFKKVNGYSNKYWGWGGEDDEFKSRMDTHRVKITRYPSFARYKMIKHKQERKNPNRYKLLDNNFKYYGIDGLTNLNTTVLSIEKTLLFTRILIRVDPRK